jgi:hypothetical protein
MGYFACFLADFWNIGNILTLAGGYVKAGLLIGLIPNRKKFDIIPPGKCAVFPLSNFFNSV